MGKLTEGQALWWVPQRNRHEEPRGVTVTKVGRTWAQLDNRHRIDVDTLVADGGDHSPPGRCYLSKKEYDEKVARERAWSDLKRAIMQYQGVPPGVTAGDIAEARRLLGVM
jgi:hypothetical protein